jgi:hypothetical protein
MEENINKKILFKKTWITPKLKLLNIRDTKSGDFTAQTEDYASGTINTQPGS